VACHAKVIVDRSQCGPTCGFAVANATGGLVGPNAEVIAKAEIHRTVAGNWEFCEHVASDVAAGNELAIRGRRSAARAI